MSLWAVIVRAHGAVDDYAIPEATCLDALRARKDALVLGFRLMPPSAWRGVLAWYWNASEDAWPKEMR